MAPDPRTKPLIRWNRIARKNREDAIVASMFKGFSESSAPIDSFTTWLLAGSATVASFYVTNAPKLLPILKPLGFQICGCVLCASCAFGVISKILALLCKVSIDVIKFSEQSIFNHLSEHQKEEEKIQEGASFWGINLQTYIRMENVVNKFLVPMPWLIRWRVKNKIQANKKNCNFHYHDLVKRIIWQSFFTLMQSVLFIAFICMCLVFSTKT